MFLVFTNTNIRKQKVMYMYKIRIGHYLPKAILDLLKALRVRLELGQVHWQYEKVLLFPPVVAASL